MFEDSSRQSLLESCKCTDLFEEVDKYNRDERLEGSNSSTPRYKEEGGCLCFEYIRLSCLPQSFGAR
ncbi:hypothetical protein Gotri_000854 [Gossypium trilobum]|uniref:Uncharacterized protein n=1 Tax=Gossypium trilobum TaxID=34281 RepID=A0A7J9FDM7_9ROSI|nr:hypothetical protein [Gossypium trilobum]